MASPKKIRGRLKRFKFQKPGWCIAEVERIGGGEDGNIFTAVGTLDQITEGEEAEFEGEWQLHPKFGDQFKVSGLALTVPRDQRGVMGFLERLPQIGPTRAKLICEHFGPENVFDVIESSPERLANIPGITPEHIAEISESYASQRDRRDLIVRLKQVGLTDWQQSKVFEWAAVQAAKSGEEKSTKAPNHAARKRFIEEALDQNPYVWTDIKGFGFVTVDRIALGAGVKRSDLNRVCAGLMYTLEQAEQQGHCYLPGNELLGVLDELTGCRGKVVETALQSLRTMGRIVYRNYTGKGSIPDVYGFKLDQAESAVAGFIAMREHDEDLAVELGLEAGRLRMESAGAELNEEQRTAVLLGQAPVEAIPLLVITGGPGTGKTTILREVCDRLEQRQLTIGLMSPTGKAAKRLSEQTGREATTIHRKLRWSPTEEGFALNELEPLPYDVVVIDEASMIDVELASVLQAAVSHTTKVIFVGDVDQLPSVGPGTVLRDLIVSGRVPTVRLKQVYRQSEHSYINVNAQLMNQGKDLFLDPAADDFFWHPCDSAGDAFQTVLRLVEEEIPRVHGVDAVKDVQVLAPVRKGDIGIFRFNAELQQLLNPPTGMRPIEIRSPKGATFRIGDKVRHIKNNYDLRVYNGETGIVTDIREIREDGKRRTCTVVDYGDRAVRYPTVGNLAELVLNYGGTIHSSQGSEYPVTVVLCHSYNSFMLSRNLIYTAITRAKQAVYLVGDEKGLRRALRNVEVSRRHTQLADRIREAASE